LDALERLHATGPDSEGGGKICLIAIDEAHCVSEWGHDFRPSYKNIGKFIRARRTLASIPILALTATASPKVRSDIFTSLHMRENSRIESRSLDRENLKLSVKRKPSGGFRVALKPIVSKIIQESRLNHGKGTVGSTIVYCPTRTDVESITNWFQSELSDMARVQPYHAGMPGELRTDTHTNFLVGKTAVVVATIAFGMGIDKPDTRRVIHYGPPKTIEEYYQQIGRAGRDGLDAECIMFVSPTDFDKYKSEFYIPKHLSFEVKFNMELGIDALRDYAIGDETKCRRATLMNFFGESPSFGDRCGTCDSCLSKILYSNDSERDFAIEGARIVLTALNALNGRQGVSALEKVINCNSVETYRYRNGDDSKIIAMNKIREMKKLMKKHRRPVSYFSKELLPSLVSRGYVTQRNESLNVPGSKYVVSR